MLSESFTTADTDMHARALREARVEALRLALATRAALEADGDLLSAQEREAIEALVQQAQRQSDEGSDPAVVEAAVKALAQGTEAFAAERMNRGIRQALAGRSVEEV
jgi:molecular chaperone HscA